MRFKILVTAAAAGVLTLSAGCASNSVPPASSQAARSDLGFVPNRLSAFTFRQWDDNGDGYLERDEARGDLIYYFDDLDKDRDGKLSPQELGISPEAIGQR